MLQGDGFEKQILIQQSKTVTVLCEVQVKSKFMMFVLLAHIVVF